ncbi:hypothetical protein GPAL_0870 [Glaciecola pallidula DSM 14239 = ACAM 615]|uniref:Uncharacterized protein n=1 Tax=Brumicola pallidula DSM 14239 = ACAM 615 TaxID=1121922 RepID=K6ZWP7_9ALTE|nr:hypothetical protein GPAL_0870 [Glaciecola pallidula DSM 14239 = ACAM 615]
MQITSEMINKENMFRETGISFLADNCSMLSYMIAFNPLT